MNRTPKGIADRLYFKTEKEQDEGGYGLDRQLFSGICPLYVIVYSQGQYHGATGQQPQELTYIRKQKMGNPILIEKKTQEGKEKGQINTHPTEAWNRAIVDPPRIAIFIHYLIEDGVPPDEGGNEVTNEQGT